MSWRTSRRGLKRSLNPSAGEEPTAQAELYILKVPVDGEQLVGTGGRRLNPAGRAASRIIAALQGWFASSLAAVASAGRFSAGRFSAARYPNPASSAPAGSQVLVVGVRCYANHRNRLLLLAVQTLVN
jgi:hypothetical protein